MGIFNNISKLSSKAIQRVDTTFELISADYVKKSELLNYYNKLTPIDMGGNKITSLADPTEDTDGINIKSEVSMNIRVN